MIRLRLIPAYSAQVMLFSSRVGLTKLVASSYLVWFEILSNKTVHAFLANKLGEEIKRNHIQNHDPLN